MLIIIDHDTIDQTQGKDIHKWKLWIIDCLELSTQSFRHLIRIVIIIVHDIIDIRTEKVVIITIVIIMMVVMVVMMIVFVVTIVRLYYLCHEVIVN